MALPNLTGFIIMTNGFPAAKVSFPYRAWPQISEAFVPGLIGLTIDVTAKDVQAETIQET